MQFDLGITRNGLTDVTNRMAQGTLTPLSPRELLRHYSDMVDGLVRKAFQKAQSTVPSPSVCLLAVGGYGRTELAPYSDVDLLLLHSPADQQDLSPLAEKVLYPLWDLGLEVNCGSRSIAECLKMAQSDLQIKTSLIDGRYLDGEYEFFRRLYDLFTKKILHRKVRKFAGSLAQDLYLRRRKYEDPAYVLEPNIKEGEGGLRDFQIGRWVVRARYKTDRWESILFPDHSRILDKSLQFLWALRNQLHLLSGRKQDDLDSENVNQTFLAILRGGEGMTAILKKMHELGFLSCYIDEFSDIEGKVHYDLYHVHPIDIHSLLAVEELERLRMGAYQKDYPLLTSLMQELEKPEILLLTEHLPARYLSCYGWGEIVHHIDMALSLEQESLFLRWTSERARLAKVTLCTKDSYGLFSKIAGSMFLNRLNILEAQIHTWGNGVVLDTFYVEDPTEEVERRLQHFKRDIEEILSKKIPVKELFPNKEEPNPNPHKIIPGVVAEVRVDNRDSDFYTIIEITGEDRLGILYEITQALTDHGCNISFARISTLVNGIVDVFYVQDEWGEKIVEKQKIENLRESLLRRLILREAEDSSPL